MDTLWHSILAVLAWVQHEPLGMAVGLLIWLLAVWMAMHALGQPSPKNPPDHSER